MQVSRLPCLRSVYMKAGVENVSKKTSCIVHREVSSEVIQSASVSACSE